MIMVNKSLTKPNHIRISLTSFLLCYYHKYHQFISNLFPLLKTLAMNKKLQEYKFKTIYKFVDIISQSVESEVDFWNYNSEEFIKSATKFSKNSLLHIYTESTLNNYFHEHFSDEGDCMDENSIKEWIDLFEAYGLEYTDEEIDYEDDDFAIKWFSKNENLFEELFSKISNEVVHILFADKNFLVSFNNLIKTELEGVDIPEEFLTEKDTIKRQSIPHWVKKAIFYRDNGRCVFCSKDLSGLITTLNNNNFDHTLPLDKMGTNDICNIQLCCEECNKSKGAKEIYPSYKYEQRW